MIGAVMIITRLMTFMCHHEGDIFCQRNSNEANMSPWFLLSRVHNTVYNSNKGTFYYYYYYYYYTAYYVLLVVIVKSCYHAVLLYCVQPSLVALYTHMLAVCML